MFTKIILDAHSMKSVKEAVLPEIRGGLLFCCNDIDTLTLNVEGMDEKISVSILNEVLRRALLDTRSNAPDTEYINKLIIQNVTRMDLDYVMQKVNTRLTCDSNDHPAQDGFMEKRKISLRDSKGAPALNESRWSNNLIIDDYDAFLGVDNKGAGPRSILVAVFSMIPVWGYAICRLAVRVDVSHLPRPVLQRVSKAIEAENTADAIEIMDGPEWRRTKPNIVRADIDRTPGEVFDHRDEDRTRKLEDWEVWVNTVSFGD